MLNELIVHLRKAALSDNSEKEIASLLHNFVKNPDIAKAATANFDTDDVILFEDDRISIWFCRFQPGSSVPPHNHRMPAIIGVFQGTERNDMYEQTETSVLMPLRHTEINAGEVLQIASDAIHGVTCTSTVPTEAIHVYLGALSKTERDLYDIDNDKVLAFTDANYNKLIQ